LNGEGVTPGSLPLSRPLPAPTAAGAAGGSRPRDPESPPATTEAVEFTAGL